jgi:hypothetical protein
MSTDPPPPGAGIALPPGFVGSVGLAALGVLLRLIAAWLATRPNELSGALGLLLVASGVVTVGLT